MLLLYRYEKSIFSLCEKMLNKKAFAFLFTKNTIFVLDNTNLKEKIMAYVISDDCVACGTCIDECPQGAISEGAQYSINPDLCIDCGSCASVCPSEAIHEG